MGRYYESTLGKSEVIIQIHGCCVLGFLKKSVSVSSVIFSPQFFLHIMLLMIVIVTISDIHWAFCMCQALCKALQMDDLI